MTPALKRAACIILSLAAATPLLGGCSSDDHDSYRSSRDYDDRSRPTGYRPDPVPGYNARQARNAQRDAERNAQRYDDRYRD